MGWAWLWWFLLFAGTMVIAVGLVLAVLAAGGAEPSNRSDRRDDTEPTT